jgi:solute carrier family 25 (adenine nucleotide translocator) protein 4/5/6/31
LDYARTRLTNDLKNSKKGGDKEFSGLFDVYKKTLATDGIVGLYRGFVITCIGAVIYRGLSLGIYHSVKDLLPSNIKNDLSVNVFISYWITFGASLASYPIDTIKRRMMMTSGQAVKYSGSIHCAKEILSNEGVGSFFKGAGVNILRAFAGSVVLAKYDQLQLLVFGNIFRGK